MERTTSRFGGKRRSLQILPLATVLSLGSIPLALAEATWQPESLYYPFAEETIELALPGGLGSPGSSFAHQPLAFERNDGQTAPEVAFLSRGRGYTLFLATNETVLRLGNADSLVGQPGRFENQRYDIRTHTPLEGQHYSTPPQVLRMRLSGASPQPVIDGEELLRAKANYFIGNQPALWRTNIPTFGKVRYKEVYPGIDLGYYGNEGQLEYDFVVAPGADPNQIAMEFEGADEMRVDERGDLLLKVGDREVRWQKPFIFQQVNGVRQEIAGAYRLGTGQSVAGAQDLTAQSLRFVSFTLAAYDSALPLVVDPRLVYSTYLGGSGGDGGSSVAVDGQGDVYVGGATASIDFPTKAPLNPQNAGGEKDVFVSKFDSAGQLLFSTYLGGSWNDDYSERVRIAVGSEGQCYVVGSTDSTDFPRVNAIQESYGGGDRDAFVLSLKADGSALIFSTYLGGEESDRAHNLALGPTGDILVVGATRSTGFPTRNAFQPQLSPPYNGSQSWDGFLTRMGSDGKSILYSTFYGQSTSLEQVWDVKVDEDGNAYLAIGLRPNNASTQWLITKFSSDGRSRLFERRWPGATIQDEMQVMLSPCIALALNERVIVAGGVNVVNLPAINKPNPSISQGFGEGYIALFNATNGAYISAVYFGGSGNDYAECLCADAAGDIVVAGVTIGPGYEASGFPVTDPLPSGPEPGKSADAFVAKFRSTDLSLAFSTLIGGTTNDAASGLALDSGGNLVVAGSSSGQLPTANAFQPDCAGESDAFLLKLGFGEKIQIKRVGQTLRLSWPLTATGYVLESADSPAATTWNLVPNAPVPEGDQNVVMLEIGAGSQFFRLRGQ